LDVLADGSVIDPDDAGIGPCGAGISVYEKGLANDPIIAPSILGCAYMVLQTSILGKFERANCGKG